MKSKIGLICIIAGLFSFSFKGLFADHLCISKEHEKSATFDNINGYLMFEYDSCQDDAYSPRMNYYIDSANNVFPFYEIDSFDSATLHTESIQNKRIAGLIKELGIGKKVSANTTNYLIENYMGCCGGSDISAGLMHLATKQGYFYCTSFDENSKSERPAKLFVFYRVKGFAFHFSGQTKDYFKVHSDTTGLALKSKTKSYFGTHADSNSFWGLYKYIEIHACDSITGFSFLTKSALEKIRLSVEE